MSFDNHQISPLSLVKTEPDTLHLVQPVQLHHAPASQHPSHAHTHAHAHPQLSNVYPPLSRYYPPLIDHYANRYSNLANQKRESVITFSSNPSGLQHFAALKPAYFESLDAVFSQKENEELKKSKSLLDSKSDMEVVAIGGVAYTVQQIVCICLILQKSDVHKLEKFVYNLPNNPKLAKNELILRARAIAAYHGQSYGEVYKILENNHFDVKYHQELQLLWNNAHYKEHEKKRGHTAGAVEKYRIRKKYQFPRTIWDGEEYVYCFKEKNRRVLKEFYQKCSLPTQEDKLKLSSQTQLTVVQISNWFKNRRQRDRQPQQVPHSHHGHHHGHLGHGHHEHLGELDHRTSDARSNDSSSVASLGSSTPIAGTGSAFAELSPNVSLASSLASHHAAISAAVAAQNDPQGSGFLTLPGPQSIAHRPYYFIPQ